MATTTQTISQDEGQYFRGFVTTLTEKFTGFYETTKDASPTIKTSIESIESFVDPYKKPVIGKITEYADPLVNTIDGKIADYLPQAREGIQKVNETWIKPSEEYVKTRVATVQESVTATEEYLQAQKQAVVDTVNDRREQVSNNITQQKEYVGQKTRDVYKAALGKADQAIDQYLPSDSDDGAAPDETDAKALTSKIAIRLGQRAAAYATDPKAKALLQANQGWLSWFTKAAASSLPSPATTTAFADSLCSKLPGQAQKPAKNIVDGYVLPGMIWSMSQIATAITFIEDALPAKEETSPTGEAEDTTQATAQETAQQPEKKSRRNRRQAKGLAKINDVAAKE